MLLDNFFVQSFDGQGVVGVFLPGQDIHGLLFGDRRHDFGPGTFRPAGKEFIPQGVPGNAFFPEQDPDHDRVILPYLRRLKRRDHVKISLYLPVTVIPEHVNIFVNIPQRQADAAFFSVLTGGLRRVDRPRGRFGRLEGERSSLHPRRRVPIFDRRARLRDAEEVLEASQPSLPAVPLRRHPRHPLRRDDPAVKPHHVQVNAGGGAVAGIIPPVPHHAVLPGLTVLIHQRPHFPPGDRVHLKLHAPGLRHLIPHRRGRIERVRVVLREISSIFAVTVRGRDHVRRHGRRPEGMDQRIALGAPPVLHGQAHDVSRVGHEALRPAPAGSLHPEGDPRPAVSHVLPREFTRRQVHPHQVPVVFHQAFAVQRTELGADLRGGRRIVPVDNQLNTDLFISLKGILRINPPLQCQARGETLRRHDQELVQVDPRQAVRVQFRVRAVHLLDDDPEPSAVVHADRAVCLQRADQREGHVPVFFGRQMADIRLIIMSRVKL